MMNKKTFTILSLPDDYGIRQVKISDILYCRSEGKLIWIFTLEGEEVLVKMDLLQLVKELDKEHFLQIHPNFLVNLQHVLRYNTESDGKLIMSNRQELPVSPNKKDTIIRALKKL